MQHIKAGDVKHIPGYVVSTHIFGRSELSRHGSNLFYIKWQWDKNKTKTAEDIIVLNRKQYQDIKHLLTTKTIIKIESVSTISDKLVTVYKTNSKIYMRVKRYLFKNNLLKEEVKNE